MFSNQTDQRTVESCKGTERRKRVVLKIGSSSLSSADGQYVNLKLIATLVGVICTLIRNGNDVILVSSGAVAVGCQTLHLPERPKDLVTKQAVAAIGQSRLMHIYDSLFGLQNQVISQLLLTRDNLSKHSYYQNIYNTIEKLLSMRIVPIVNENDVVSVEELRVGDNDTLSALVSSLIEADWLVLITDVDGLYNADPRKDLNAQRIPCIENVHAYQDPSVASRNNNSSVQPQQSGRWGTGGMSTKIQAAKIATAAGVRTFICSNAQIEKIPELINPACISEQKEQTPSSSSENLPPFGTLFLPLPTPLKGKKKWLAHGFVPSGVLYVDQGAARALLKKKSLFAAGIVAVQGHFQAHSNVIVKFKQQPQQQQQQNNNNNLDLSTEVEVARGLVNYASDEIDAIKGLHSNDYAAKLGYHGAEEVIHRENLVLSLEQLPDVLTLASPMLQDAARTITRREQTTTTTTSPMTTETRTSASNSCSTV